MASSGMRIVMSAIGFLSALFVVISFAIYGSIVVKLRNSQRLGKRMMEECGIEYLEGESDKFTLYSLLHSKQAPVTKRLRISNSLLHATMIAIILCSFIAAAMMLPDGIPNLLAYRISIAVLCISFVATISAVWPTVWIKEFNKLFYQNNDVGASEVTKKLMASLIGTYVSIFGLMVVLGIIAWKNLGLENSAKNLLVGAVAGFLVFAIIMIYVKQATRLITVTNTSYYEVMIAEGLQPAIDTLWTNYMATNIVGNDALSNIKKRVQERLIQHYYYNIRDMDKVPSDSDERGFVGRKADDKSLWKYTMHRNGQEFEAVRIMVEQAIGDSKDPAISKWRDEFNALIRTIRGHMRNIRTNRDYDKSISKVMRSMQTTLIVAIFLILFSIFHSQYRKNAGRTVLQWCIGIIVVLLFGSAYGWVSSAMRL